MDSTVQEKLRRNAKSEEQHKHCAVTAEDSATAVLKNDTNCEYSCDHNRGAGSRALYLCPVCVADNYDCCGKSGRI